MFCLEPNWEHKSKKLHKYYYREKVEKRNKQQKGCETANLNRLRNNSYVETLAKNY